MKNSLSLWGVETSYDYITDTTTVTQPENTAYQSELLNNEVEQNLIPGSTSDSAKPNMVANARIYSLNGFSLRKGAVLPSDVASQIHLATASGTASGALAVGQERQEQVLGRDVVVLPAAALPLGFGHVVLEALARHQALAARMLDRRRLRQRPLHVRIWEEVQRNFRCAADGLRSNPLESFDRIHGFFNRTSHRRHEILD